MPGPKPPRIALSPPERSALEQCVRRRTTPQQIALRARLVLAAATDANNSQIARQEGVNVDTVRLWRTRWFVSAAISLADLPLLERLSDAPRSGNPGRMTDDQVGRILELAGEAPERSGRPISHGSEREIADEVKARGIVDQLSGRHAARLRKRGRFSPIAGGIG